MKICLLVSMLCIVPSCYTVSADQIPCPQQEIYKPTESEKQKDDEKASWEYAENDELVTAIEQSDPQKWILGVSKNVILGEKYELMFNLKFNKIYFRMSIFSDGSLYLDGGKKEVALAHRNRLIAFYNKVVGKHV